MRNLILGMMLGLVIASGVSYAGRAEDDFRRNQEQAYRGQEEADRFTQQQQLDRIERNQRRNPC